MPHWQDLILSWQELQALPVAWSSALAHWRGVYFAYNTKLSAGYVGSACGQDNLLGR